MKAACRLDAVLAANGQTFAQVEVERRAEDDASEHTMAIDETTSDDMAAEAREAAE